VGGGVVLRLSVAIVPFGDNILPVPMPHVGQPLRCRLVGNVFLDNGADNDTGGVGLRNTSRSRISGRVSGIAGHISGNIAGHISGRLDIDSFYVSVYRRGLTRIPSACLQFGNN
jgi:hypothetical protein